MSQKLFVAVGTPKSDDQPRLSVVLQSPGELRDPIIVRDVPVKSKWVNAPSARLCIDYGPIKAVPAHGWLDAQGWWPNAAWGVAMKGLDASSQYLWKPSTLLGENTPIKVVMVEAEHASEKLLDPDFLEEAQRLLKTEVVAVAVPRRGVIYASDAKAGPQEVRDFVRLMKELYWDAPESERLTESPVLVSGRRLMAWMQSDEAAVEAPRLGVTTAPGGRPSRRRLTMPKPSIGRSRPLPSLSMPAPGLMHKQWWTKR